MIRTRGGNILLAVRAEMEQDQPNGALLPRNAATVRGVGAHT